MSLEVIKEVILGASGDIGTTTDPAVTDPEADASVIAALKGLLELQGGGESGVMLVSLATALSSEYDTIDVAKMSKGGIVVTHNAITATATGDEIDCRGFNGIIVECAVSAITSGNWVVEVLGCAVSGGIFGRSYDSGGGEIKTPELNVNETVNFAFVDISNYVKIKATRTTDGTLTCKITPYNR